jgi:uncharacterized repeat protein (TIGR04138 family)
MSRTITRDLPCMNCGYNLRALPTTSKCPECGQRVLRTWDAARRGMLVNHLQAAKDIIHDWYAECAQASGIPADGLFFVNDAIRFLPVHRRTGPDLSDTDGRHMTAADVCTAVREYANVYFNNPDEAREALEQWYVRTSEDVGRIIFALVDAKFLKATPDDTLDSFKGIFTFEDLLGGILWQAEPA